ncbi:hypothetical protein CYMTET_53300, partial [Cymbomonas tetramitiformis]
SSPPAWPSPLAPLSPPPTPPVTAVTWHLVALNVSCSEECELRATICTEDNWPHGEDGLRRVSDASNVSCSSYQHASADMRSSPMRGEISGASGSTWVCFWPTSDSLSVPRCSNRTNYAQRFCP